MDMAAIVLGLLATSVLADNNDVVIKPTFTSGFSTLLFMVPGKLYSSGSYATLASQLQSAAQQTNKSLWIAVPAFKTEIVDESDIESALGRVLQLATAAGLPSNAPYFVAAHGPDSGHALQAYLASQSSFTFKGLALFGSTLLLQYTNATFAKGLPVLTVGGTLDGVWPISQLALSFYHQISHAPPFQTNVTKNSPIALVDGMSHTQLSSDAPPPYVQSLDLKPEITTPVALAAVSTAFSLFVSAQLEQCDTSCYQQLASAISQANTTLAPLTAALLLEGSYALTAPCYLPHGSTCQTGSPWMSVYAQSIMANLSEASGVSIDDADLFWPVDEVFPHDYLPIINNTCPSPSAKDCVLHSRTVTELYYNSSTSSVAAAEFLSKLNSRQRVWVHAGLNASDFNFTDAGPRCAEINMAAYMWALDQCDPVARTRFSRLGQPLVMGSDVVVIVYPLWSSHRLSFTPREDSSGHAVMEVTSPTMRYAVSLPAIGGLHFCKLLSPARAMEWVYVDGLRLHGGLGTN